MFRIVLNKEWLDMVKSLDALLEQQKKSVADLDKPVSPPLGPPQTFYCSFCGKSQHETAHVIAGKTVCICAECVEESMSIILEIKIKARSKS